MGRDKLFLEIGGAPLLMRTVRSCRRKFATVTLVAGALKKLEKLGCRVLLDWPRAAGPMAGIIAALEDCPDQVCFVTAADLYDLDGRVIERLVSAYRGEQYVGLSEAGLPQPLCGLYHRSALPHLTKRAADGDFRMIEALAGLKHRLLQTDDMIWRNINRPGDLDGIGAGRG
jgi:molybdopterin-guanine dinucleotide biosynthesis protein A